ncbi:MAG TPA: hypothetical protein VF152_11180 [Acidimicrobiia bacterium]
MTPTRIGNLDSPRCALVDRCGRVGIDGADWSLDWWIGGEDRRHVPGEEASLRQRRPGVAPVVETALRVPSGDAVERVYGAGGRADLVVVEIENASPVPFAAGLVVRGRPGRAAPATRVAGNWLSIGGGRAVLLPRPPLRRETGDADAFVYPVAHRTRLRFAVVLEPGPDVPDDLGPIPGVVDVARSWDAHLSRGMRIDVADAGFRQAVDRARADLLLAPPDAVGAAALEDWGFDAEFGRAWARLSYRARRRARRRPRGGGWAEVRACRDDGDAARFLLALRALLVRDAGGGDLELVTELPREWLGQDLEVHDAPTRRGRVSFAVRWHGERPALLWQSEGPGGLRAPGLDPAWSADRPEGEALLAPHPRFGVGNLQ